jgi:hypothetical protein
VSPVVTGGGAAVEEEESGLRGLGGDGDVGVCCRSVTVLEISGNAVVAMVAKMSCSGWLEGLESSIIYVS